jgi:hypothetical protein
MSDTSKTESRADANERASRQRRPHLITCLVVLFVAVAGHPAIAEEYVSDKWQFTATPYLWALSLDGDVTVKGNESEADVRFEDILDDMNWGVMLEAEVRKNRWGLFISPLLAELEAHASDFDVEIDIAVVGFGGTYRLGPWALSSSAGTAGPKLVTDVYAGGRYTYLHQDLNGEIRLPGPLPTLNVNARGSEDWIDPIIGARTLWFLSRKWTLVAAGDIGGFGVGSDFAWQATGVLGYNFRILGDDNARVYLGYRAMSWDYKKGSGSNKFEWDVTVHGPVLCLSYHF